MNKKIKICLLCLPALLNLSRVMGTPVVVGGNYAMDALELMKSHGIRRRSRYDIAKGIDLVAEYFKSFEKRKNVDG